MQPSWTFRIVERVKHIEVQPRTTGVPFGLLRTAGLIVVLLILIFLCGSLFPLGGLIGSVRAAETQIAKTKKSELKCVARNEADRLWASTPQNGERT